MSEPDDDERVRALLGSLRDDGPTPPAVVERLDARLAELSPTATPAPHPRHRVRRLLAAAAAVVVVGGVGSAVVRLSHESGASSGSASDSSVDGFSAEGGGGAASASRPPGRTGVPVLTAATFRAESVTEFARRGVLAPGPSFASGCGSASPPAGVERQVPVVFDRHPALLRAYAVTDGARLVRAVACSDGRVLATTRVPVP